MKQSPPALAPHSPPPGEIHGLVDCIEEKENWFLRVRLHEETAPSGSYNFQGSLCAVTCLLFVYIRCELVRSLYVRYLRNRRSPQVLDLRIEHALSEWSQGC